MSSVAQKPVSQVANLQTAGKDTSKEQITKKGEDQTQNKTSSQPIQDHVNKDGKANDPSKGSQVLGNQGMTKNLSQSGLQKSQNLLVTIENYDPIKFQHINSPRSMTAMKDLFVSQEDLKMKTADDLKGMFNLEDQLELKAFQKCVEKHKQTYLNLKKKVSERRKEMILAEDELEQKRKEHEIMKAKQLKKLEEEKKVILKQIEIDHKKKDEVDKKKKAEMDKIEKTKQVANKQPSSKSMEKLQQSPKADEKNKGTNSSIVALNPQVASNAESVLKSQAEQAGLAKSTANMKDARGFNQIERRPIKLDDELKESSILVFLDKGTAHKDLLDLNLVERTKKDLEKDKQRMKELMQKQKQEIIEMSRRRNPSAYKSQDNLGNAKTRKIEYLYDLSRNPVDMMKEKQQKEMEYMMNYEIALQSMRKQREDFLNNKHQFLKGEQQYKEIVFEYNKKILERERQLKEMQKKIDQENKLYHVERTKKVNELERNKMISKLTKIDDKAKYMKEDRQDYIASRRFMVQKLKKDLENMKAGLMQAEDIEKKYHFLHNDVEFQSMMKEVKKELHPGNPT